MSINYGGKYKVGPPALQWLLHQLGGYQIRAMDLVSNRVETLPKVQICFSVSSVYF